MDGEFTGDLCGCPHYYATWIPETFDDDVAELRAVGTSSDPLHDKPTDVGVGR
jgi:hypothetical protein